MTKLKKIRMQLLSAIGIFCLIAVIAIGLSVKAFNSSEAPEVVMETVNIETYNEAGDMDENDEFGAISGYDVYHDMKFWGRTAFKELTQGGGCLATSTAATSEILLEADLLEYNCLEFTSLNTNFTWTLPATSTWLSLLPNVGDMREWIIENTASSTLTIAAGTGIDLIAYTTNDDVIDGTEYARLTCIRQTDTDITCITSELVHAD